MFTVVGEEIVRRESVGRLPAVDQVEAPLDDLELRVRGDGVVETVINSAENGLRVERSMTQFNRSNILPREAVFPDVGHRFHAHASDSVIAL